MHVIQRNAILASTLLFLCSTTSTGAQNSDVRVMAAPVTVCELPIEHEDMSRANEHTRRVRGNYDPNARGRATFNVTYNGFSGPAQTAFQFAVDIWEQHIESNVPIKVTANWVPLAGNILGSAGAALVHRDFPGAPIANTWYGSALADALAGIDLSPAGSDINANFNSTFPNWYFGTDGNTPGGQTDFVTVVLHELGHGLGFFGTMEVDNGTGAQECDGVNGNGCWDLGAPNEFPAVYDRFAEDGPGIALINTGTYPNPSAALGSALRSNSVHFDGAQVVATIGMRGPLYAPTVWNAGSSYSHWNEASFPAGDPNSLMTPFISAGESIHSPGAVTCAAFEDVGWTLGTACSILVANEPEALIAEGESLENAYPNPFSNKATLTLRVDRSQHVRAVLYDLLGRQIVLLYDGDVRAETPITLFVEGGSLRPGVYFVRVAGEQFVTTRQVVRVD